VNIALPPHYFLFPTHMSIWTIVSLIC